MLICFSKIGICVEIFFKKKLINNNNIKILIVGIDPNTKFIIILKFIGFNFK